MMISKCCVCLEDLHHDIPDSPGVWHEGKTVVSHGYCKKHAAEVNKELDLWLEKEGLESTGRG